MIPNWLATPNDFIVSAGIVSWDFGVKGDIWCWLRGNWGQKNWPRGSTRPKVCLGLILWASVALEPPSYITLDTGIQGNNGGISVYHIYKKNFLISFSWMFPHFSECLSYSWNLCVSPAHTLSRNHSPLTYFFSVPDLPMNPWSKFNWFQIPFIHMSIPSLLCVKWYVTGTVNQFFGRELGSAECWDPLVQNHSNLLTLVFWK